MNKYNIPWQGLIDLNYRMSLSKSDALTAWLNPYIFFMLSHFVFFVNRFFIFISNFSLLCRFAIRYNNSNIYYNEQ